MTEGPTALILDDDLGFCIWLGQALTAAGVRSMPVCRSEEALAIGADMGGRFDLLIVNPRLKGCGEVLEQNKGAKVIAIGGPGKYAVDATIRRPRGRALPPAERYLSTIRAILEGVQ